MSEQASREDSAVIQNENIAAIEMSRKTSEEIVFYGVALAIKNQHARRGAISERLLRDEFRRKIKVKVGDEHGSVDVEPAPSAGWWNIQIV